MRGAEKGEVSVKGFEGEESREDEGRRTQWSREQVEEKGDPEERAGRALRDMPAEL